MGASESTRKCAKCGVQLLETNMVTHTHDCTKLNASGKSDGSWDVTYSGPSSGIKDMTGAISATSRQALDYKK